MIGRKLNAEWHRQNPMPKNATMDQRVAWHVEHAKQCGCREIPRTVADALEKRALKKQAAPTPKRAPRS